MRILCVHQGFELYGSDRCFAESVQAIRKLLPTAKICAVIPRDGPLASVLRPFVDELRVEPLWVLRKRGLGRLLASVPFTLPLAFSRVIASFRANDLVYINTVTVLDHLLAAAFFRRKALLHVHEAPAGLIYFLLLINTFESIGSKSTLLAKFVILMIAMFRPQARIFGSKPGHI